MSFIALLTLSKYKAPDSLRDKILAPRNKTVSKINDDMIKKIPDRPRLYKSIDRMVDETDAVDYPVEFLHSLEPPGTPPHNLALKIGAPIMLLRNMDPPKLCNGTKLVVKKGPILSASSYARMHV